MIDSLAFWLTQHAALAPLWIFCLLLLTGFSIPISEDVMVIVSGVLAGSVLPEQKELLFLAAFLGAYFSDWIAYWMGRLLGNRLSKTKWFSGTLSTERRSAAERFFARHGFFTLFLGRFIPFGVRNSIFMAAGAIKMHFGRFILGDGLSCLIFSLIVFSLAFRCGENYASVYSCLSSIGYIAAFLLVVSVVSLIIWKRHVRGVTRRNVS
jgi:membrane protein DedA with SNARE-associated domain